MAQIPNETNNGIINCNFQREGYCINRYENDEQYFGYYIDDKRNKQGFYTYNPEQSESEPNTYIFPFYFGNWKNDLREGHGIYLWLKKTSQDAKNLFPDFDSTNFAALIGYFSLDKFKKGSYIQKIEDNYFVYHGTYDENNKKNGKDCFYYNANYEILYYGSFSNDNYIKGYVSKFDDNGEIKSIIKYGEEENMEQNFSEKEKISEIMKTFRNVIMSKDYFGIVFETFKSAVEFRKKFVDGKTVMNFEKNQELIQTSFAYRNVTLYKDVEKYIGKIII